MLAEAFEAARSQGCLSPVATNPTSDGLPGLTLEAADGGAVASQSAATDAQQVAAAEQSAVEAAQQAAPVPEQPADAVAGGTDAAAAAAAAAGQRSGAGEDAGELQPQSDADKAAAEALMKDQVGWLHEGFLGLPHMCCHARCWYQGMSLVECLTKNVSPGAAACILFGCMPPGCRSSEPTS